MFKVGDKLQLIKHWSDHWPFGYVFICTQIIDTNDNNKQTRFHCMGNTALNSPSGTIYASYCKLFKRKKFYR